MEVDNSLSAQIFAAFGDKSLYEILGVTREATSDDIRRAYRRLALKLHPDKGGNEDHFKALCVVHAVLSDSTKRQLYDSTGDVDTHEMSEEAEVWYDYFRNIFPKVTVEKIEEFSKTYKGSEEERNDIIKYYTRNKGDFRNIMDSVMLAEEEDSERIIFVIKDCISTGELQNFRREFEATSSSYVEAYKLKVAKEKSAKASGKSKKSKKEDDSDALLQQMIQNNARRRGGGPDSIFNDIVAKYASDDSNKKGKKSGGSKNKSTSSASDYDNISDEAFAATQARIEAKKRRT